MNSDITADLDKLADELRGLSEKGRFSYKKFLDEHYPDMLMYTDDMMINIIKDIRNAADKIPVEDRKKIMHMIVDHYYK